VTQAKLYRSLYRIRRLEEEVARVYATDKIKSPVHLSIGQEAASVGVCECLKPQDVVFGTYRGHAMYLAKGGDIRAMVAELYGKATGCTKGKGGSMHLIDPEAGVMGTSAVVGTTIANAAGFAYALKLRDSDAVVVSFFGDGATEEGVFAETLNFAALKQLPVLFVCENNGYAIHTHQTRRQGRPDICARAEAYGIPAERLDGNDVLNLVERTGAALGEVRSGHGPRFFEVMTYRWREHVGPGGDYQLGYRTLSECEPWVATDPVRRLAEHLPTAERDRIEAEVEREVAAAFAFAEASPIPDAAELMTDIFTEEADALAACQG
jgi:TPP-dependent pyruvate/acetoin dehydrogenase alpha subunit